jgi:hypothetical protein
MSTDSDAKETDTGTGPAHIKGTHKGEDLAKGKSDEELKDERRSGIADDKPIDDDMPDQA